MPANPVDTGQAEVNGAVHVWQATARAAQERLDGTLGVLHAEGLQADGAVGDSRPLVAVGQAVSSFGPDGIVICTHPSGRSVWLGQDVVTRAQSRFGLPVRHVVAHAGSQRLVTEQT